MTRLMTEDEYRNELLAAGHTEAEAEALIKLKRFEQGTPEEQGDMLIAAIEKIANRGRYDGMFVNIDIPPQPEDRLAHDIEKFSVPKGLLGEDTSTLPLLMRPIKGRDFSQTKRIPMRLTHTERYMIPDIETDFLITAIAIACHNANKKHCESIGDNSQKSWSETPENIRDSAIDGVSKWWIGDVLTPEQSHESWLAFKEADGFVYGEVKDLEKKTHPCMVPYGDLPEEQRKKDAIFMDTVHACMDAFGIERP